MVYLFFLYIVEASTKQKAMIRLHLQRLLTLRDIKQGRAFLINHRYTPDEVRGLLRNTPKEIGFEMMTRLCTTFNCLPNDLLTWDGEPTSHLNTLKRPDVTAIEKLLEGKTPQEIERILKRIERGG
jgi:hypothetical protein